MLTINIYLGFSSVMAEEKKAEGNQQYSRKNYEEAVKLYTEAIGNVIVVSKTRIQRENTWYFRMITRF